MQLIITGAASGIGRSVALTAAERFGSACSLAIVDRDAENLKETEQILLGLEAQVVSICADMSDSTAGEAIVAQVRTHFDGLTGVVSNAGVVRNARLIDLNEAQFDHDFSVNTRATWSLAKASYELLKQSRGALVATASITSEHPLPNGGVYAASKAALVMLVRQLAYEWAADGIRCNCVSPGSVLSGMHDQTFSSQAAKDRRAAQIPLGRLGEPRDIADAILFLLSSNAAYITGANLLIDGGLATSLMPASAAQ